MSTDAEENFDAPGTRCLKETEAALLCTGVDLDGEMWVPKSVVDDDSEVYSAGDEGTLIVKAWWAEKRGLL